LAIGLAVKPEPPFEMEGKYGLVESGDVTMLVNVYGCCWTFVAAGKETEGMAFVKVLGVVWYVGWHGEVGWVLARRRSVAVEPDDVFVGVWGVGIGRLRFAVGEGLSA
jgi:hypothetical protein